jgi:hypothetical protein
MPVWLTDCLPAVLLFAGVVWRAVALRKSESVEKLMASRRVWVQKVMSTPGHEILAVQTVRNSLMAASMMATTAALGVGGSLSIGKEAAGLGQDISVALLGATASWTAFKTALLAATLAAGFFLFSLAVRFYHRVGYTLAGYQGGDSGALETASAELMRGAAFYRAGWRTFYTAIVCAAWFFGTWPMFVAGAVALGLDHAVSE